MSKLCPWTDRECRDCCDTRCRSLEANYGVTHWPPTLLPVDSAARKEAPVYSGLMAYFPLALAEVARLSKYGNDKHNPGEPLHWSREKSDDHYDCAARHLLEIGTIDPVSGFRHAVMLAWRALAILQLELENETHAR